MSGQDDDGDKSFEATPEKLLKARKKGEIPRSTDLLTSASYLGLTVALSVAGASSLAQIGSALSGLIQQAGDISIELMQDSSAVVTKHIFSAVGWGLIPLFLLPSTLVLVALFAQRAIVFAPSKLKPKLNRISILSNTKNKFGRNGLFEFFKSFVKLCIYSLCLTLFIRAYSEDMIAVVQAEPAAVIGLLGHLFTSFLLVVVLISLVIGGIDAVWQHQEHLRKNRMSRKEITDETKDAEGDPHMKQARRQKAMTIAQSQMMQDVPQADVIIVNPTHYAVALKWSRAPGEAPVCVAKGVDEIAATIREIAMEASVPIHSDPPTARALHATTNIGDEIKTEHYAAVAAAIRFAEAMREKARHRV